MTMPGQRLGDLRTWALWAEPAPLVAWVLGGVVLTAGLVLHGLLTTSLRTAELVCCLVLVGCAAVCIEASRREGEPAGIAKDLLSAWTLPVALLLPPVYSLLIPVPLMAVMQVRVRRGLLYRRAASVVAIALANGAVSWAFHRYVSGSFPGGLSALSSSGRTLVVLVALGCAAGGSLLNIVLIGIPARITAPGTTWRHIFGDRSQRLLEGGEACLGVVVAGCWLLTPVLALAMLVPTLMAQRTLTHAQLRAAARTDAKTGLLNARAWQEETEREIVRAHRDGLPLAVLVADLDHFKRVNDAYGHLAGDAALVAAVGALRLGLRPYDQLGRFGGEEFTVVLPRTDAAEAARVAERLRAAVAGVHVPIGDGTVRLTVSMGVAVLGEHGDDLTELLVAADHALYRAKRDGRDRVEVAAGSPASARH